MYDWKSNATLLALTYLTPLAGGILQVKDFGQDQTSFLSAIQTFLMQFLSLYTALLPALRHDHIYKSYRWWTWALAFSSLTFQLTAITLYKSRPEYNALLSFLGSALQAFVALQLILSIGDAESRLRLAAGKHE
jgi:hypothetical protein